MGTWKFAYLAIGVRKENTHFTVGFGIALEELQVIIIQKRKGTEASTSLQQRYQAPIANGTLHIAMADDR